MRVDAVPFISRPPRSGFAGGHISDGVAHELQYSEMIVGRRTGSDVQDGKGCPGGKHAGMLVRKA